MLLAVLGLASATLIVTESLLFARVRALWPALLGCPLCLGFWVGIGGAAAHGLPVVQAFEFAPLVGATALTGAALWSALGAVAARRGGT